jgi:hypothetical protein
VRNFRPSYYSCWWRCWGRASEDGRRREEVWSVEEDAPRRRCCGAGALCLGLSQTPALRPGVSPCPFPLRTARVRLWRSCRFRERSSFAPAKLLRRPGLRQANGLSLGPTQKNYSSKQGGGDVSTLGGARHGRLGRAERERRRQEWVPHFGVGNGRLLDLCVDVGARFFSGGSEILVSALVSGHVARVALRWHLPPAPFYPNRAAMLLSVSQSGATRAHQDQEN